MIIAIIAVLKAIIIISQAPSAAAAGPCEASNY